MIRDLDPAALVEIAVPAPLRQLGELVDLLGPEVLRTAHRVRGVVAVDEQGSRGGSIGTRERPAEHRDHDLAAARLRTGRRFVGQLAVDAARDPGSGEREDRLFLEAERHRRRLAPVREGATLKVVAEGESPRTPAGHDVEQASSLDVVEPGRSRGLRRWIHRRHVTLPSAGVVAPESSVGGSADGQRIRGPSARRLDALWRRDPSPARTLQPETLLGTWGERVRRVVRQSGLQLRSWNGRRAKVDGIGPKSCRAVRSSRSISSLVHVGRSRPRHARPRHARPCHARSAPAARASAAKDASASSDVVEALIRQMVRSTPTSR